VSPRTSRRREIELQSTFALIAELALGLAGFAGVAAAFGGRDRIYAPVEITRLRSLFVHASLALAVSLFAISLIAFDLDPSTSCYWPSAFGALGQALAAGYFISRAYGFAADPNATTRWWAFGATAGFTGLSLLLFVASLAMGGHPGPLVSALSVQLLFGLWVFTRVLIHRN